ncbi:MAG: hypothetical protein M1314_03015 [Firmicutes bacterium]|nr:hypothetical protein [Bacillota bacterium]
MLLIIAALLAISALTWVGAAKSFRVGIGLLALLAFAGGVGTVLSHRAPKPSPTGAILAGRPPLNARGAQNKWAVLQVGQRAYLQTNAIHNGQTQVCQSVPQYEALLNFETQCSFERSGQMVKITAEPSDVPSSDAATPPVRIQAADGAWGGVVSYLSLQPIAPSGTQATAGDPAAFLRDRLALFATRAVSGNAYQAGLRGRGAVILTKGTRLVVLKEVPGTLKLDVQVRVESGEYAGRSGWMLSTTVEVACPNGGRTWLYNFTAPPACSV